MEISISIKIKRDKHPKVIKHNESYAAVRFEPLDNEEINIIQSKSSSEKSSSANTS